MNDFDLPVVRGLVFHLDSLWLCEPACDGKLSVVRLLSVLYDTIENFTSSVVVFNTINPLTLISFQITLDKQKSPILDKKRLTSSAKGRCAWCFVCLLVQGCGAYSRTQARRKRRACASGGVKCSVLSVTEGACKAKRNGACGTQLKRPAQHTNTATPPLFCDYQLNKIS